MGELLLLLIAGHYLADFGLQNDFMAQQKGKVFITAMGFHCLTAHAMIHGLVAAAVAGALSYPWLMPFVVVAVSHWLIDFGKSWERWPQVAPKWTTGSTETAEGGLYGINTDQYLHVAMMAIVAMLSTL